MREILKYRKNTVERILINYAIDNNRLPDNNSPLKTKEIVIKDDDGNIIERNEFIFDGRSLCHLSRKNTYDYKLDDKGNWIERMQSEDGIPQFITERTFEYYE